MFYIVRRNKRGCLNGNRNGIRSTKALILRLKCRMNRNKRWLNCRDIENKD